MGQVHDAIARLEAEGALPKQERETLEDECTHILSERLNDQAPLYEEAYRPHARRMIQVIGAAERSRIRRELLAAIETWWFDTLPGLNSDEADKISALAHCFRAALDRICSEE